MATNVIRLNKDGQIEVDGVVFDIREFINKIDKKVNLFIQDNKPEEYGLLDFWYAPTDDILSVSKFINNELVFIEVTLAGKTLSASISGGTGGVSQDAINNLASSLSAQIESVRTEMRSTFKDTINLSSITPYHLISGDCSVTNEVIANGFGIYTYTGNSTTPPSIPLAMPITGQWGDSVDESYGYMIEIRARSAVGNWSIIDSIRGLNKYLDYNISGVESVDATLITSITTTAGVSTVNIGTSVRTNTNGITYVMTVYQTTHQKSELTNQNKSQVSHYNPWSGVVINRFMGSGLAGHKVKHYLNRPLDLMMLKCTSLTDTMWVINGNAVDKTGGNRLVLGSVTTIDPSCTAQKPLHNAHPIRQYDDGFINDSPNGTWENGMNQTYMVYGWSSSYFDAKGKLIGSFEIGKYSGNSTYYSTIIQPRDKPALLKWKPLNILGDWFVKDIMRQAFTGSLTLQINNSITETPMGTLRLFGKNIVSYDNDNSTNGINVDYLYFIVYDNANGSGKCTYLKPSDNPNINVNNAIIPFVNGVGARGQLFTTINKNETITGLTFNPGKNWVYYDKTGVKNSKVSRPRYSITDLDSEFPGDAPDVLIDDQNMWYTTTSSGNLFPNPDFNTTTSGQIGYDNGNGTVFGYENLLGGTSSIVSVGGNNMLKVTGNQWGTSRIQLTGLVPGREYYFSCTIGYVAPIGTNNGYIELNADADGVISAPTKMGRIGVDRILYKFIPHGTTKYVRFVNTNAVETNVSSTFDNIKVWEANCTIGSVIPNSRNYLNHVFYADDDGNLIREEELPKIKYLNNLSLNNVTGINGKPYINEQGTFQVYVEGVTTPGVGTYGNRSGTYTRIGNRVNFEFYINVYTHTGTGDMIFKGLPFIPANFSAVSVAYVDILGFTANTTLNAFVEAGRAFVNLDCSGSNAGLSAVQVDSQFSIMIAGSYLTL